MSSQIALILFNLLIAGTIFTHLALTTPVIFKTLDENSAAKFLRTIFPRYYLLLFLLSLPAVLILYFQDSSLSWWLGINISAHLVLHKFCQKFILEDIQIKKELDSNLSELVSLDVPLHSDYIILQMI